MAIKRKEEMEARLMALKKLDPTMRFQVRNGVNDLQIFIKHHHEHDYSTYLEFKLDIIDGETLPKFKTNCREESSNLLEAKAAKLATPLEEFTSLTEEEGRSHPKSQEIPLKP